MKQDNELDQQFRDASNRSIDEEIPSAFLLDLNSRLDALEPKRKKTFAIWWWSMGVFFFALFTWGIMEIFNTSTKGVTIATRSPKSIDVPKSLKNKKAISANKKFGNLTVVEKSNQLILKQDKKPLLLDENKVNLPIKSIDSKLNLKLQTSKIQKIEIEALETSLFSLNSKSKENQRTALDSTSGTNVKQISTIEPLAKISIPIQGVDSASVLTAFKDSINAVEKIEKIEIEKQKKKIKIQKEVGFFSGVSGILSSFEIPTEIENTVSLASVSQYREKREREEVSTTSWDLALRMKWIINGFTVQTGLDYFQWGEHIRYNYNSINGINRYSYLNIPLNLGYLKKWEKFGINPSAGLLMGYGFNRKGNYLQTDLISIVEVESAKYVANYQIACDLYFLSESKFKFSITPVFRSSFKEVVYTDLIRNRYKSIGLQLGISYIW